jgi:hypothetical protein
VIASSHESVYLHPLTLSAVRALGAIRRGAPSLRTLFDLYREDARSQAVSAGDLAERQARLLAESPDSMTVGRLLDLDADLRLAEHERPVETLARSAAQSGVPIATIERYRLLASSALWQPAYLAGDELPRSITVELHDGTGPRAWEHRANLLEEYRHWRTLHAQLPDRLPARSWYDIRIPLSVVGMTYRPICGLRFAQQGPSGIVWGDAVLRIGDTEEPLDLGGTRTGTVSASWFDVPPSRGGGRSGHRGPVPSERYAVESHAVESVVPPLTAHLLPPDEGEPYLSQWVYLDSDRPAAAIALQLHGAGDAADCWTWGEKQFGGIHRGSLPPRGRWCELRAPFGGTALESRPIRGVSFGADRGRVLWGPTAVVARGVSRALVDGALPEGARARRRDPEVLGVVGAAFRGDGRLTRVSVPHTDALEPRALTVEAWVRLDRYPPGREKRRWIVAKNHHEQTEGHYGLMICWNDVGAYLNIGDGREHRYEAWSQGGLLSLGVWHHLAMTYDQQDLIVYLDGAPVASTSLGLERTRGEGSFAIGKRPDGYVVFDGWIDEVSIFGRALVEAEVRDRWASVADPKAVLGPSMVELERIAHWGFEDIVPPPPTGEPWGWVDDPKVTGRRVHTHAAGSGYGSHGVTFSKAVSDHLSLDLDGLPELLEEHLPRVGASDVAWKVVEEALILLVDRPTERMRILKAFVRKSPNHPRAWQALERLVEARRDAGQPEPIEVVGALLDEIEGPWETAYAFRRRLVYPERVYVRSWRVFGPVPPAEVPFDPSGPVSTVGWARHETQGGRASFQGFPDPAERLVAYAATTVRASAPTSVVLELERSDADCRVLVRGIPVLTSEDRRLWSVSELGARVDLPAGTSQVLVEVAAAGTGASFTLELVDPSGLGAPPGLEIPGDEPR